MPIVDQGTNLFRVGLSFFLVYVLWPVSLFKVSGQDWIERFFARFLRMVFLTIILGYVLVAVKLYELLSLFGILFALTVIHHLPAENRWQTLKEHISKSYLWFFDVLDGRVHPLKTMHTRLQQRATGLFPAVRGRWAGLGRIVEMGLFVAVFAAATIFRYIDPLRHAAPAMSDSYVTLAWMKYIDEKILFHDGIYPQGFHIYLSVLHKFAGNDALYTLKYAGPLNGVLMTLGVYLFVRRLSGRVVPGIVAAFMVGVMGQFLPLGWDRQAATNSQEFALVFLLPAWHYTARYLDTGRREHLWSAAAAFAVIGLVHSLVLAFLWAGLGCLLLAHFIMKFRTGLASLRKVLLAGGLAGIVAALPVPLGFLLGKSFNSSSAEFLTSSLQAGMPPLTFFDWMGLSGFVLFFIDIVLWKRKKPNLEPALFALLLGSASFLMYLFLGPLTRNAVLVTRIGLLWSLAAAVGCGLLIGVILKLLPGRIAGLESVVCLGLLIGAVLYFHPEYPRPYRVQYDSSVNQYLRISHQYTSTAWMMVSEEGYPLALGEGWHYQLGEFLKDYNPARKTLARMVNGQPEELQVNDIFIFAEKKLYPGDMDAQKQESFLQDYAELANWVKIYMANHTDMTVYYSDPDITVYHIHHPQTEQEKQEEIWGA